MIGILVVVLLLAGAFLFLSRGKTTIPPVVSKPVQQTQQQEEVKITYSSTGFSPNSVTIKAGTKVTWTNTGGGKLSLNSDPHPTHSNYRPLNLGFITDGQSKSLVFDTPGTYGYHNHFNASDTGTVIVK